MTPDNERGNGGETPEFNTLLDKSMEELRAKTTSHQVGWGFGKAAKWSLNLDEGNLLFTFNDGVVATCPAQIVGSLDTEGGTWLWGWANPSIPESLQGDAMRVREYGLQHQIDRLNSEEWPCTEEEAWRMAALACKLCEAQGVYRGPAGTAVVFITFGKVVLSPGTRSPVPAGR
jgi:hypothetical protein